MKNKKTTVTRAYIDELKRQIKNLEQQNEKIIEDRKKFREFFLQLLKDNISMSSKNEHFGTQAMITKLSKLMNQVENWWW